MNIQEFSNEFDILYNNIMSNKSVGITEFEKSIFLTKAQEEILKNYFNPLGNKYQKGLDDSEKRQIDFSELITIATSKSDGDIIEIIIESIDDRARNYKLPSNVFLTLNEAVIVQEGVSRSKSQIIPLHYSEYARLMLKPYKEPKKGQVWKLLSQSGDSSILTSTLIPKSGTSISEYKIRYIRRPKPIILTNLSTDEYNDVSIDGHTSPLSLTGEACELNPNIHREILNRAVEIAKISYIGDPKSLVEINSRGE